MNAAELAEVVRPIIGQDGSEGTKCKKPEWLEYALLRLSRHVRNLIEGERTAPSRTEIRDQLARFRDAVGVFKGGLHDPVFMLFLGHDRTSFAISDSDAKDYFERMSMLAHEAWCRLSEKARVPVAYPNPDGIGAQMLCAWTVMHAMQLIRGRSIGPDSGEAILAANALWKASGGVRLGSSDGSREATGWRHHFLEAKIADSPADKRANWLAVELSMMRSLSVPDSMTVDAWQEDEQA